MPILDHKKTISVILSRMGETPEHEKAEGLGENIQELHVAAEDIINAIHSKDKLAVTESLIAFLELFESHKEEGG